MSIVKFIADADTTITDAYKPYTTNRAYYANMGAADSLEMFSIAHSGSNPEISRILINFPLAEISASRSNGTIPASGSVNFILRVFNVEHPETLPKNYYASIKPISGSWEEGDGLDLDNYTDLGTSGSLSYGSNWIFKSSTTTPKTWTTIGGDFYNSYEKSFYFETGTEDIELDITHIVESQLSGTINSTGVGIMLSGSYESGSNETFYTKRFSARSSEYFYKLPCVEARWEAFVKDDRGNFYFESDNLESADNQQNIYFYNRVNGVLKNLPSNVTPLVTIKDSDGNTLLSNLSSSKVADGTYKLTFSITGSADETLEDIWFHNTKTFFTGEIDAKVRNFYDTSPSPEYVFNIKNLKKSYKQYENPAIRIFSREKNWSPNIYKIAYSSNNSLTFKNLYYKIVRIVDDATIIDYGIEPIAYTKCSYDKEGNYFDLNTALLEPGYAYGIKLMYVSEAEKVEIPDIFRFKVE